jgi:hypothetical protein
MMKLSCTLRGEFKNQENMVRETTCGLSFHWKKGESMMELDMVVRLKVSTTTKLNFPYGKLHSIDDIIWKN